MLFELTQFTKLILKYQNRVKFKTNQFQMYFTCFTIKYK